MQRSQSLIALGLVASEHTLSHPYLPLPPDLQFGDVQNSIYYNIISVQIALNGVLLRVFMARGTCRLCNTVENGGRIIVLHL